MGSSLLETLRYLFLISSQNEFHLDTDRVGNDGQVFARPLDLGLSDGQDEVALEDLVVDLEGHAVHQLVLQDHDRIGISDGSLVRGQNKAMRCLDRMANQKKKPAKHEQLLLEVKYES